MPTYGALNNANIDTAINLNGIGIVGGGGIFPSGGGTITGINLFAAKISGGGTQFRMALYAGGTSSTNPNGATRVWESGLLDSSSWSTSAAWRALTGLSIAFAGSTRLWLAIKSDIAVAANLTLSADCGDLPVSYTYYTGTTGGMNVSDMATELPATISAAPTATGGSSNLKFFLDYTTGSAPTISAAGTAGVVTSAGSATITGTGFGATQGTGKVYISPTNNVADGARVEQTVTAWSGTSITITPVKGSLSFDTNYYLFVVNDAGFANSTGFTVQVSPKVFIRDRLINKGGTAQTSQTGLTVSVWRAAGGPTAAAPNPDQVIEGVTTDGSGNLNVQINRGALAINGKVWVMIHKAGSPDKATARRVTPVYE